VVEAVDVSLFAAPGCLLVVPDVPGLHWTATLVLFSLFCYSLVCGVPVTHWTSWLESS